MSVLTVWCRWHNGEAVISCAMLYIARGRLYLILQECLMTMSILSAVMDGLHEPLWKCMEKQSLILYLFVPVNSMPWVKCEQPQMNMDGWTI